MKASAEEREATTNAAAFRHWLRAVHGRSQGDAALLLAFAGPTFTSARLAAGLLLAADLRPDDRVFVLGSPPDWLDQALRVSLAARSLAEATVFIADAPPETWPRNLRVVIQTGGPAMALPPDVRLTRSADWTYPSESIAD